MAFRRRRHPELAAVVGTYPELVGRDAPDSSDDEASAGV
jgi:hypothetical protein